MLRKITLKAAIAAVAVAGAGLLVPAPAKAADTTWKMHMVWVPARPEAKAYQKFADNVSESAGDALDIQLFNSGSLGVKDADMLRILPRGNIIQAAGLYPGYLTRDKPQYAYTLPAGVVSSPEKLKTILPDLRSIYEGTYDEAGIKLLGFVGHAVRDTHIMCKEPVNTLEELRSKKLRVWEQFHVDVFEKLGVSAQIIGQNDLYVAMQTGVVDCAVYPIGLAVTVSLQEVAPYASYLFPYVLHPLNLIVSQSAFDELSPEVQQVVMDTAAEVEEESFESYLSGVNDTKALEQFEKDGGTLLDPFPEEDRQAFVDAARETWKAISNENGEAAQANYETLSKAIE
ncbi:C4-dicarboxylate ABC transporter substrate-binding protein [Roseovarius spongiae]|uniref:C4-dicarboxylate ABC transporter substrate-binding protein n=1 Tax=Roseovarius spongiae TaxID=2320272 RepID=A0A3A8AUT3_9RHOB|nr:TRAP transporter substrate-binding protein DctP [Roseovarius spongiae]RKF12679.1 C4-dicarboxylate ABC transporter substrate-binding protein [Roseovarius spongiae]